MRIDKVVSDSVRVPEPGCRSSAAWWLRPAGVLSGQECARYLETFKAYESKPADLIQGRADEDYLSRLNSAITTVTPASVMST